MEAAKGLAALGTIGSMLGAVRSGFFDAFGRALLELKPVESQVETAVEHTVRDAADIGYRVRLFPDCCASGDMEAHRATLRTMPMLADLMESREALPG